MSQNPPSTNNNNNNKKKQFKFSPSIFAAWNYFNCPKQLRYSLEKVKKNFSTTPTTTTKSSSSATTSSDDFFETGFPSISGQETTGRGNIFEDFVFDYLEKHECGGNNQEFINFDNIHPNLDGKTIFKKQIEELGIEEFFMQKILVEQVLSRFFAKNNNAETMTYFLAQVPLTGTKELEKSLFLQKENDEKNNTISFSTMYPDILIVKVSSTKNSNTLKISVKIVDVKSSKKMKPGHCMQVATYYFVLNSLFLSTCVPTTTITNQATGETKTSRPLLEKINSNFPQANITNIEYVVEKQGEIWLPASPTSENENNNNQQQQQQPWKESRFEIDPEYTNQVRDFVSNTLLPLVVTPKFHTRSYAKFLLSRKNNNNNNNNDDDDEDEQQQQQDIEDLDQSFEQDEQNIDVPFPTESRGMNSVCSSCDFKLVCKKSILANQTSIPTSSVDEQIEIVNELVSITNNNNKNPKIAWSEKMDEVFFRKAIAAVPYPFSSSSTETSSPCVITADLASSNIFLEYIWKCATKFSCLKIAHDEKKKNNTDPFYLPFITSSVSSSSSSLSSRAASTSSNFEEQGNNYNNRYKLHDFKYRCVFIEKYSKKYFGNNSNIFFSPLEITNSFFQTSRPSRMLTLDPVVSLSLTFEEQQQQQRRVKKLLVTSFYVILTTKNSATNHTDIHRIIISEQEVVFASKQKEIKSTVWTKDPNTSSNRPTTQISYEEIFEIDLSLSEKEARVIFDKEMLMNNANNEFYKEMLKSLLLTNNDDDDDATNIIINLAPRHFVTWDSYSAKLLTDEVFPQLVKVKNENKNQQNEEEVEDILEIALGVEDLVTGSNNNSEQEKENDMIRFYYPRITPLQDVLNAHFCFSSSCGGILELNEVADAILLQTDFSSIRLPPYVSLNDFGLGNDNNNFNFAHRVPKLISQVFCKTYEILSSTNNGLRPWPVKRPKTLIKAKKSSSSSSSSPHHHRSLYTQCHDTLSLQATASWLDRGNPASTFVGSFAPPKNDPSFYRLEVKFLLRKPESSSSSSASERLRQISVAKNSLIDSVSNDALWRSDVDAMRRAISSFETFSRSKNTRSQFRFCSYDGELDPEVKTSKFATKSRSGRWYLVTTSASDNIITKKQTLENLFDPLADSPFAGGKGIFVSPSGNNYNNSNNNNNEGSFLSGKYCLSQSSTSRTDFFDSICADERYVFGSNFKTASSGREQEYKEDDLVLCDIVCVEDLSNNNNNNNNNNNREEPTVVTLGLHLYIHNNKSGPKVSSSSSSTSNQLFCLSPRLVNTNMSKTMNALKSLELSKSSTLLVDSATSPSCMMILPSNNNTSDIINVTARKILDDVNRSLLLKNKNINLSDEHKRFLNHVENFPTTLLWGPPGAGKTQTLAITILSLLLSPGNNNNNRGKNVLIVAATHKALQQLHEKLDELGRLLNAEVTTKNDEDDDQNEGEEEEHHIASSYNFSSYYANNKIVVQRIDNVGKQNENNNADDAATTTRAATAMASPTSALKAGQARPTESMSRIGEKSESLFANSTNKKKQNQNENDDEDDTMQMEKTASSTNNNNDDNDDDDENDDQDVRKDHDGEEEEESKQEHDNDDENESTVDTSNPFNIPSTTTTTTTAVRGRGRPRKDAPPIIKPAPKPRGRPKKPVVAAATETPTTTTEADEVEKHHSIVRINDSVPTYKSYGSVGAFESKSLLPETSSPSPTEKPKKSSSSTRKPLLQNENQDKSHSMIQNNVVICTMWKASALFSEGIKFDVLVVDEASQIQFINAVAASLLLKNNSESRLIVAGDPLQFSPIISDGVTSFSTTAASSNTNNNNTNNTTGKGFSSQVWTRSKCKEVYQNSGNNNNNQFNLATASVFDALMFDADQTKSNERFTDIVALTSSSSSSSSSRIDLCGMYQLPHSFRSTPEIVQIVQKLYPRFSIFPNSKFLNSLHFDADGNNKFATADRTRGFGIFVTVIKNPMDESSVIADRVYKILNSSASKLDRRNHQQNNSNNNTDIAIVTPRRHQRAKIREELLTIPANFLGVSLTQAIANTNDNNNTDYEDVVINQITSADFASSRIVVDTTERMQGDQANAIIIALGDVRNTKFALNLRRLNVAVSRAIRYVELVIHEKLLPNPTNNEVSSSSSSSLEEELKEYDKQEDDEEESSKSGKPKTYCLRSLEFLRHFVQVAIERGGNGAVVTI